MVEASDRPACYDPYLPDPGVNYQALRQKGGLSRFDGGEYPLYALSRHGEIRACMRDNSQWSQRFGQLQDYKPGQGLNVDPPRHTELRRLLQPLFSPARVVQFRGAVERIAEELVSSIDWTTGPVDLHDRFSCTLALHVAAMVLGIRREDREMLRDWIVDYVVGSLVLDQGREDRARQAINRYFAELLAERRQQMADPGFVPPNDMISLGAAARHADGRPYSDEELTPSMLLILIGGLDTQAVMLSNCVQRLLERRELWLQVVTDPGLAELAIEESLRFDSPVFGTFRTNNHAFTLGSVTLPADSKVQMLFASGNRDPAAFDDPDRFRLDRDLAELRRNTLAFGSGIHTCIGAPVARLAGPIGLRCLAARLPGLQLAGEPRRFVMPDRGIAISNGCDFLPVKA